jgi:hypothetical protein
MRDDERVRVLEDTLARMVHQLAERDETVRALRAENDVLFEARKHAWAVAMGLQKEVDDLKPRVKVVHDIVRVAEREQSLLNRQLAALGRAYRTLLIRAYPHITLAQVEARMREILE